MTARRTVPESPPAPVVEHVGSGLPVKGNGTWKQIAEVANYLNAHEMSLIAATGNAEHVFDDTGSSTELRFVIPIRNQVRKILWVFTFGTMDLIFDGETTNFLPLTTGVMVQIGSGTEYGLLYSGGDPNLIYIEQDITPTSTPYEETITLSHVLGDPVRLLQVAAYEVRRYSTTPVASNHPVYTPSCGTDAPIKSDTYYNSISGVVDALTTAKENCRRASQFAWSSMYSWLYVGQGSSWNPLFHESPEVLARYITDGASTTAIACSALIKSGNVPSDTAHLRFVASSGDSATISVTYTAATGTWITTYIQVYTELLTDSKGRRDGAERIAIEVYGNGNTVDSYHFGAAIRAICIGEE